MSGLRPLGSPRRHRGDIRLDARFLGPVRARRQLDQGMQRNFHPGASFLACVQEVRVDAPEDRLVGDDDDVFAALEFHDNRLQADDHVAVRFAAAIPVIILVFVARLEIFRVPLRNVLVRKAVAHPAVEFVKRFPLQLFPSRLRRQEARRLRCSSQRRCPDDELGVGRNTGLKKQVRESTRIELASFGKIGITADFAGKIVLGFSVLEWGYGEAVSIRFIAHTGARIQLTLDSQIDLGRMCRFWM